MQPIIKGLEQLGGFQHPVRQGGTGQVNTEAVENDFQPIQRQAVHEFGDNDISQQAGGGKAAWDWLGWFRGGQQAIFKGTAAIFDLNIHDDLDLCRNDFQLFGLVFARLMQGMATATHTLGFRQFMTHHLTRDMFG